MFLEKQNYILVNKKDYPCEENWNITNFIQCFREDLIEQNQHRCIPFYWYHVLIEYYPNITLCKNEDENHGALNHITDLMANYSKVRILLNTNAGIPGNIVFALKNLTLFLSVFDDEK